MSKTQTPDNQRDALLFVLGELRRLTQVVAACRTEARAILEGIDDVRAARGLAIPSAAGAIEFKDLYALIALYEDEVRRPNYALIFPELVNQGMRAAIRSDMGRAA